MIRKSSVLGSMLIILLGGFIPYGFALLDVEIQSEPIFNVGDLIVVNVTLKSDTNETVIYEFRTVCENAPPPYIEMRVAPLTPSTVFKEQHKYLRVDETLEPQTCTAIVFILSPVTKVIEKNYTIVTDPSLDFRLIGCTSSSCDGTTALFTVSNTAYLDYESNVENVAVSGNLVLPDGSENDVTIPTSIKLKKAGTYTLEVTASKEGYKQAIDKFVFYAVEEGSAEGATSGQQKVTELGKKTSIPLIYPVFLIPTLIIIGLIIYLLRLRKKQKEETEF